VSPSAYAKAELGPVEIIQADKSDKVIAATCIALLLVGIGYWINEYQHRDSVRLEMEACMADYGIKRKDWYSPTWREMRGVCWTVARERGAR
jgi:hypothetical protein